MSEETEVSEDTKVKGGALECMMIPIKGQTLIVPKISIAEMAQVAPIFPDNSGPDWFLGYYSWRDGRVPLVSFEKLNGETVAGINPNGQIAVFNNTGIRDDVPFIAIPTQGIPRDIQVAKEDILGFNFDNKAQSIYEVVHIRVGVEELIVPDISGLEKAYCTYSDARRL